MKVEIGAWVMRSRYGVAHLVQSVVAGDAIVQCGRRLSDEPTRYGGELVSAPFGTRKCHHCTSSREDTAL